MGSLSDQLKAIAARYPEMVRHESPTEPAYYLCAGCREHHVTHPGALCAQCLIDQARGYRVRSKAGRCRNGAERDHGTRFHALPTRGSVYGDDMSIALCGTEPGRRSVGWSTWGADQLVTCPRCIKKLERLQKAGESD